MTKDRADAMIEELAVDYCQLFILPSGGGSPHESLHVSSSGGKDARPLLWGAPATAVKDLCREYGFTIREESLQMPDALSVELEFMEKLCEQEVTAEEKEDVAIINRNRLFQRKMLLSHLGGWFPTYARSLRSMAKTPFYQSLIDLAANFIEWETVCAQEYLDNTE